VSRARLLLLARIAFVVLTVAFAWWGFHGRWDDVADALRGTEAWQLLVAVALTAVGLLLTALLWRHLLSRIGSAVPVRDAAAVFLVGQLGKYIPGSVWSFAAQARLGRTHGVPARASVAASSVFLLVHTMTGVVLGAALAAGGVIQTDAPSWLWVLAAVGATAVLAPPVVRRIAGRIAGQDVQVTFALRDLAVAAALMATVWLAYGAAVRVLLGPATGADLAAATGAFALSHAAGVLLVLAPAGLGAREGVLVALLGPVVGVGPAAAVALLARVVHTVADFAAAGISALAGRRRSPEPHGRTAPC
jgi:hypothetical protein